MMDKTLILHLSGIPGPFAREGDYQVSVHSSFGNTAPEFFELRDGEKVLMRRRRAMTLKKVKRCLQDGTAEPAVLDELGEFLYRKAFQPNARRRLDQTLTRYPLKSNRLRLCLSIADNAPYLETIPWEYLKSERGEPRVGWFARRWMSVTHTFDRRPPGELAVERPLKILLAYANPFVSSSSKEKEAEEAVRDFFDRVGDRLRSLDGVEVRELWKAGRGDFARELSAGHDLVHFVGHGYVRDDDRRACLRLEDDEMDGLAILEALPERPPLLIYLNSCSTALADEYDSFTSLAQVLVKSDANPVPAVVAMQYDIYVNDSLTFAEKFYESLFEGWPDGAGDIELALSDARYVIDHGNYIWGVPLLFLQMREKLPPLGRGGDGGTLRWHAPQGPYPGSVVPPLLPFVERPESGEVAALLRDGRAAVVVHGEPGSGRTSVTRAAVEPLLEANAIVTWQDFEGLDAASSTAATLYLSLGRAFGADLRRVWEDAGRGLDEKIEELEKVIPERSVLVLENVDSFFAEGGPRPERVGDSRSCPPAVLLRSLAASRKEIAVVITARARPSTTSAAAGWRCVRIKGLGMRAGVRLLREAGVGMDGARLSEVVEALRGNPRALRIFAAVCGRSPDRGEYLAERLIGYREAESEAATHELVWRILGGHERAVAARFALLRRPVPVALLKGRGDELMGAAADPGLGAFFSAEREDGLLRLSPFARDMAAREGYDAEEWGEEHGRAAMFFLGEGGEDTEFLEEGEVFARLEAHYHFRAAGRRAEAVHVAEGLLRPLVNLGMYSELETLLAQLEEDGCDTVEVRLSGVRARYLTGDYDSALELLDDLQRAAEMDFVRQDFRPAGEGFVRDNLTYTRAAILAERGALLRRRSRPEDAEEMEARFEAALELLGGRHEPGEGHFQSYRYARAKAEILYQLGTFHQYMRRGRREEQLNEAYRRARDLFRRMLSLYHSDSMTSDRHAARIGQARAFIQLAEIYGDRRFAEHDEGDAGWMLSWAHLRAEWAGDRGLVARVFYERARIARRGGRTEDARGLFRRASELAEEAGALDLEAKAEAEIAEIDLSDGVYSFGRLDRLLAWCEEKLAYFSDAQSLRARANALYNHALLLYEEREHGRADLWEAEVLIGKCRRAVERIGEGFWSEEDVQLLENTRYLMLRVYDVLRAPSFDARHRGVRDVGAEPAAVEGRGAETSAPQHAADAPAAMQVADAPSAEQVADVSLVRLEERAETGAARVEIAGDVLEAESD